MECAELVRQLFSDSLQGLSHNAHSGLKQLDNFNKNLYGESEVVKIFEGGMMIRTLPTYLLQIFCERFCNSQVIVKNMINPDRFLEELLGIIWLIKVFTF